MNCDDHYTFLALMRMCSEEYARLTPAIQALWAVLLVCAIMLMWQSFFRFLGTCVESIKACLVARYRYRRPVILRPVVHGGSITMEDGDKHHIWIGDKGWRPIQKRNVDDRKASQ